jgi:transcriptional regulator with PAS, ATPase and Fis domain
MELGEAIQQKQFREDLYYRLAAGILRLPSLRERPGDIPRIALHILQEINQGLARLSLFASKTDFFR